ncbi:MAG: hypothetical protein A2W23_05265 [Planctomycetes bacterium RBG_16_43_13]|nr:MAG: hypothetical protein A2W23_05265 [Planctomycetes bacterium RBG_16_43_13]
MGSNAHPINGAATGLTATNRNYELTMISGTSTFDNNFSIRIPFLGLSGFDASTLRILWWDTVSSTWKQDYQSVVSNTDKYVEVKASHMTEFGLFGSPSSGGGGGGGGGCFIATAVYGNPNDANVISLIKFRDCYVSTTAVGRTFITTYNTIGPRIANTIGDSYLIKEIAEVGLYPIVTIAKIAQLSTLLKVFILLLFANLVIAVVIRRLMANIIKD